MKTLFFSRNPKRTIPLTPGEIPYLHLSVHHPWQMCYSSQHKEQVMEWNEGYGVVIHDLETGPDEFPSEDVPAESAAFERLQLALAVSPDAAINELVQIAIEYCNADSAGISLEEVGPDAERRFRWIAVAGSFARYLNGTTPRFYSPCGTCLDRGVPQRYQVFQPYYNFLGVDAEPIQDGLLLPWLSSGRQGTLWVVSHHSKNAFTLSHYRLVSRLATYLSSNL